MLLVATTCTAVAQTLSVGGRLFHDLNNDGFFEPSLGETGVAGVQLQLWQDNDDGIFSNIGDHFESSVQSDLNGFYVFSGLEPGNYLVAVNPEYFGVGLPLNGFRSSTGNDPVPDPDDGLSGDDNGEEVTVAGFFFCAVASRPITLSPGTEPTDDGDSDPDTNLTVDFGFRPGTTVSVGGILFRDLNNNGIFEPGLGETGINGVGLQIWRDDGDGVFSNIHDQWQGSTSSSTEGHYLFTGLIPGSFLVVVNPEFFGDGSPLNGFRSSTGNDPVPNADNDVQGDDNGEEVALGGISFSGVASRAVTVSLGGEPLNDGDNDSDTNLTVDFGFKLGPTVSVGGVVFRDLNNNGIFEPGLGETGIDGVLLHIWRDSGDGISTLFQDQFQGDAVSGNGGEYLFSGLVPGEFSVEVRFENFLWGSLFGLRSSTGNDPVPDPDDDVIADDSGYNVNPTGPEILGVISKVMTVRLGTEPTNDGDNDPDTNRTLDFGFAAQNEAPSVACPPEATIESTSPIGTSVSVAANISDPDSDGLSVTLREGVNILAHTTLPRGTTAAPNLITFSGVLLTLGNHYLTISASDGIHADVSCDTSVLVRDTTPPQYACPPNITVPFNALPPPFVVATDNCDPHPIVTFVDSFAGVCPTIVTRTYTATDASGNSVSCQQLITVNNVLAVDAIIWHQPLARHGASEDTEPGANGTLYSFKPGSTIPIMIQALGCAGAEVISNPNVVAWVTLFADPNCGGLTDGVSLPIEYNGVGAAGGLMVKTGGHFRYNLDTKTLPKNGNCFGLKITVNNTTTGETRSETLQLQANRNADL